MDFPLVYIIVLNWNSPEETIGCIESLESLSYPNYQVVIVDNASSDNSEAILRARFPSHFFIQTGCNLGYAGGNNHGIRHAMRQGAAFIWIVNPDVTVASNSLGVMVKVMTEEPSIGICGPRILWGNSPNLSCIDGAKIFPEDGYRHQHNETANRSDGTLPDIEDAGYVIGCSMLIRNSLLTEIGLLREDFFLYFEEVEFNLRARSHGWRTVICRQAQNIHKWKEEKKNDFDIYLMTRNSVILARTQKKYVFQTVMNRLAIRRFWDSFKRGHWRTACKIVYGRLKPVALGLLMRLEPVPRI